MINRRMIPNTPRVKSFPLKGGLNTEVSNMERTPGELLICKNYYSRNGAYSGYQSIKGYERYDGRTSPSSVALEEVSSWVDTTVYALWDRIEFFGGVYYCIQAHTSEFGVNTPKTEDDNAWWVYEGAPEDVDTFTDLEREDTRSNITAVGEADGAVGAVTGLHTFDDKVIAFRNNALEDTTDMYQSSASGWTQVAADSTEMSPDATIKTVNARFAEAYAGTVNYAALSKNMWWVDSVTTGYFVWNGTDDYEILTDANLPSEAPVDIGVWENRMFLVYAKGHIFFSRVGEPDNWDSSTGYAGEIYLGDDITGIHPTSGALIIFTRRKIYTLSYGSTTDQFIFKLDEFSSQIGALENTIQSLFETVYFCEERGASQMVPSDRVRSGFETGGLGQKVETEFLQNKSRITSSAIDKEKLRYFVFYTTEDGDTSNGLVFTFFEGKLKGVGRLELDHKATVAHQGVLSDGAQMILFGDDDGYVYRMEQGTSFDGSEIISRFMTSFYHYGSPRNWKEFVRAGFEIACDTDTTFEVGSVFNYGNPQLPKAEKSSSMTTGGGVTWGSGVVWGSFTWSGGYLGKAIHYINGQGTTMSFTVLSQSKFKTQHTVHNITVDYHLGSLQQ